MSDTKIVLEEKEMPTQYYNILHDIKKYLGELPPPPLHPQTKEIIKLSDLEPIFCREFIQQTGIQDRYYPIEEEILEMYKLYRPTPLIRAKRLERFLQTPAKIYFKYEGYSPTGSHKLNAAIPQAYYNKKEGQKEIVTETGAGQWGSALAVAARFYHLNCTVFMSRISYQQKPYRRVLMEFFGAKLYPSPSDQTKAGRKTANVAEKLMGSLGISISEALEHAIETQKTKYCIGSVLDPVLMYQTIIGQEAKKQMEKAGVYPDIVIGCCGGGSNLAGISYPFLADKLSGDKKDLRIIAVEPTECPSLTSGEYRYDSGDSIGLTPLLMMFTMGKDFIPASIHAGGLRYHGDSPTLCFLYDKGFMEAVAYPELEIMKAAQIFSQQEGIIPAPESAYAIKAAIDEAINAKKEGTEKTILFNLSGHGFLDLQGYDDFMSGKIKEQQIKGVR